MRFIYMRNRLLPLIALLLLTAVLMACNGSTEPTESTSDSATEAVTETTPDSASETDTAPAESDPAESESAAPETETTPIVEPDTGKVADIAVTDQGYDIYKRIKGNEYGYRYGCTYLYNDDGSVDAYFACIGIVNENLNMNEWDWISYRHSPDGGVTWEPERIVLTPTHGSQDSYSLCDPGVVYFGGYYYLAYTSTLNAKGMCNNIYVARSQNPDGPFEKWNGNGWGGYDPQPILYYDESYETFGIGEPSMIELNGTLYIYYSHIGPSGDYTMVATADATDENWPSTIENQGAACQKSTDSLDVKYVEEWGKFIAVAAGDRMTTSSWLALYESYDGLRFELVDLVREGTYTNMHNVGISSRPNGHIRLAEDADKLCVIYAYGDGWGTWNTRLQSVSLSLSDETNDLFGERIKDCLPDEELRDPLLPVSERHVTMLRTDRDVYTVTVDTKRFRIRLYQFDTYFNRSEVLYTATDVEFIVYDESVVTIDKATFLATVRGEGTTAVEVRYGGCKQLFHVSVTAEAVNTGGNDTLVSMEPIHERYTVYLGESSIRRPQLRVSLCYGDGRYTEVPVEAGGVVVTYSDYDKSIISVSADGILTALKAGETEVTLSCKDKTCTVKVKVSEDEADSFYKTGDHAERTYDHLDFTKPGAEYIPSNSVSTAMTYDAATGALRLDVTQEDPQIHFDFPEGYRAENYTKLEITYMAPTTNSANAKNRGMQFFYCVGNMSYVDEQHSTVISLKSDGEFHTLTVDLTKLYDWKGEITSLRFDYINIAAAGDTMYIRSIKLS